MKKLSSVRTIILAGSLLLQLNTLCFCSRGAAGDVDLSFDPGSAVNGVNSVSVQPDGKVLVASTSFVIGTNYYRIARLNGDGSLDSSFITNSYHPDDIGAISSEYDYNVIIAWAGQADGKVLTGGYTVHYDCDSEGCTVYRIWFVNRVNANGSRDTSFNPGLPGSDPWLVSVVVQSDGKVLIGGLFGIARFNANGSTDISFNPATPNYFSLAKSVTVQSDGKLLIGGSFTNVSGTSRNGIARLNADGSLDVSFNPGTGVSGGLVSSIALQADGKVLIGGRPNTYMNGTNRYGSARLNADGSLDNAFISSTNFKALNQTNDCPPGYSCWEYTEVIAVRAQPDGKVLLGGNFVTIVWGHQEGEDTYSLSRSFLARFSGNGGLDSSFNPGTNSSASAIALQPDGKVLLAGNFTVNGAYRGMARLNADGSLDNTFNPGIGINGLEVHLMALQPDGKVLIGGSPSMLSGTNRHAIARLNANGSLDSTFNPTTRANDTVQSLAVQPDGKVLIAGRLYFINSTNPNTVARLNADGSLDTNFHNPSIDGYVLTVALQSDGDVLIGGDFTIVNGVARPRVARLYGDTVSPSLHIARSNAFVIVSWPVSGLNFQLQETTDLSLPNSWSPVAQPAVTNVGQISVTVPTTVGRKFFQLKSQ